MICQAYDAEQQKHEAPVFCRSGVSRMSAYHHFGMVSPFRVARDASKGGNTGARKFADEFLTWRELAYCFCYHNSDILESLQVCILLTQNFSSTVFQLNLVNSHFEQFPKILAALCAASKRLLNIARICPPFIGAFHSNPNLTMQRIHVKM